MFVIPVLEMQRQIDPEGSLATILVYLESLRSH